MFKVYVEKKEEKGKKEMFFKLEQDFGYVRLILVDKDGDKINQGNVLRIDEDGLQLFSSVTEDAPFKLDREGCIVLGESI